MSIKNECFALSKKIWSYDIRAEILKLTENLNSKTDLDINDGKSLYSQFVNKQRAQFMGFLITSSKQNEVEQKTQMKLYKTTEEERILLEKAHFIFTWFNRQVIKNILDIVPNLEEALDPYCLFDYESLNFNIEEIISTNDFFDLIQIVKESHIVRELIHTSKLIGNIISKEDYTGIVLEFESRIIKSGVHSVPEDFRDLTRTFDMNNKEDIVQKHILLAVCLRSVISNINQLLFQAFLNEKLMIFDWNNIIDIKKRNSHVIGSGLTLIIQPNGSEFFNKVREIVLSKYDISNPNENGLFLIHGITTSFNKEWGTSQEYQLRMLDDNLNPFFNLI